MMENEKTSVQEEIKSTLISLKDYENEAKSKLDAGLWEYISTGSCFGETTVQNAEAYKRYYIIPRVLRDVSVIDTSTTLLGQKVALPIGVCPSARHRAVHHEGEAATGKGAMRSDVCMILGMLSYTTLEEVAEACQGQGLRWMQLQPIHDDTSIIDIVQRAEKANYKALVVTCDDQKGGVWYFRHKQTHTTYGNFSKEMNDLIHNSPGDLRKNLHKYLLKDSGTWDWIDWLRSITSLPIVLKGIISPEDAKEAIKHDIQAIIVSNHGGRHIDGVPPTIDALSDIIETVDGKVEVYVDGGIRLGTDVFKALALGARAVFVGRPIIWGLACNGEEGVHDVIQLIGKEFKLAMASTGCCTTGDITSEYIRHISYYNNGPKVLHK